MVYQWNNCWSLVWLASGFDSIVMDYSVSKRRFSSSDRPYWNICFSLNVHFQYKFEYRGKNGNEKFMDEPSIQFYKQNQQFFIFIFSPHTKCVISLSCK